MTKKFEFTGKVKVDGNFTLHQIVALKDFGEVKTGDLGGWIEKESNLAQDGNCWVSGNAQVYGNAWVSGNAQVYGNAWVSGDARVYSNAQVSGTAWVSGNACVYGDARVYGDAQVAGDAQVSGDIKHQGSSQSLTIETVYRVQGKVFNTEQEAGEYKMYLELKAKYENS